ncbi:MAG: hypothetical protein JWN44_7243 [Myxococcales bacterium]|nr:hypothetical protein [Myxococcales bacterium]
MSEPPATGNAPASAPKGRDDRLALAAILLGAGIALLGLRSPFSLSTGMAIGLAGALLAVRGERPVPAPRLMAAALVLAVLAVCGVVLLGFYEEWEVGQRLSEGAAPGYVTSLMRPYARVVAALRSGALFCALSFLLGATVTRLGSSGK